MGKSRVKIGVTGLRGFPDVQGGIERHAESLVPLLVELGFDMVVYMRAPYVGHVENLRPLGYQVKKVWCPRSRFLETLVSTLISVLAARIDRVDLLHIHGIGPSLFAPLARILGMRVVVTHHGQDYLRQKWGRLSKIFLRLCEFSGVYWSNSVISISREIRSHLLHKFHKDSVLIPNGCTKFGLGMETDSEVLARFGLEKDAYILSVGRIVPEKRHLDLIGAFLRIGRFPLHLVIVGGADHGDPYSEQVYGMAGQRVRMLGVQARDVVGALYRNCALFVLPSSHEGLPIAALEAISCGARVLLSDIGAHIELGLGAGSYFKCGDLVELSEAIQREVLVERNAEVMTIFSERYDWSKIASDVAGVYASVLAH